MRGWPKEPTPGQGGRGARARGSLGSLFLALIALGGGLVEIAVGAGAPVPFGALPVTLGLAHLAWAGWTITTERPRLAGTVTGISGGAMLGSALTLAIPDLAVEFRPLPLVAIALLNGALAVGLTALRRWSAGSRPVSQWGYVAGLIVGAALLSAVLTPALAATEVGDSAEPHGHAVTPEHRH